MVAVVRVQANPAVAARSSRRRSGPRRAAGSSPWAATSRSHLNAAAAWPRSTWTARTRAGARRLHGGDGPGRGGDRGCGEVADVVDRRQARRARELEGRRRHRRGRRVGAGGIEGGPDASRTGRHRWSSCRRSLGPVGVSSTLITVHVDEAQRAHGQAGGDAARREARDRLRVRQPRRAPEHVRGRWAHERFDAAEVERSARHGRPRNGAARVGTVDVSLATSITEIHGDRLLFRGHDAVALAPRLDVRGRRRAPLERRLPPSATWPAPPRGARVARAAIAPLPTSTSPIERLAVITAALACAHPLRTDLRPATVAAHARAMLATFVELLPGIQGASSRAVRRRAARPRSVATGLDARCDASSASPCSTRAGAPVGPRAGDVDPRGSRRGVDARGSLRGGPRGPRGGERAAARQGGARRPRAPASRRGRRHRSSPSRDASTRRGSPTASGTRSTAESTRGRRTCWTRSPARAARGSAALRRGRRGRQSAGGAARPNVDFALGALAFALEDARGRDRGDLRRSRAPPAGSRMRSKSTAKRRCASARAPSTSARKFTDAGCTSSRKTPSSVRTAGAIQRVTSDGRPVSRDSDARSAAAPLAAGATYAKGGRSSAC